MVAREPSSTRCKDAYLLHREGRTDLPHSSFLRFGDGRPDRIIALPGRIEDDAPVAGIKWIASFPGNVQRGMARASALLVLNSTETGRPTAVIESSIVSAQRTAASAALAARELHAIDGETTLGLIGCGVINFEIARFVLQRRAADRHAAALRSRSRARARRVRGARAQALERGAAAVRSRAASSRTPRRSSPARGSSRSPPSPRRRTSTIWTGRRSTPCCTSRCAICRRG